MSKEIFALFSGQYSDWQCHGYYTTSEEAEKAAIALNRAGEKDGGFWYALGDYYVVPLKCIDGTNPIFSGAIIYNYSITWSRQCGNRDIDYFAKDPYILKKTIAEDEEGRFENEVCETLQDIVDSHSYWPDRLEVRFCNNRYLTDEQVLKIAYDMVADWKAKKEDI